MADDEEGTNRRYLRWLIGEYVKGPEKAELTAELEEMSDSDVAEARAALEGMLSAKRIRK